MPEEKIVNLGGTIEGFPVQETGSFNGGNGVPPSVSVNDIYNSIGTVPTGRPSIDINSFYTGDRYNVALPGADTEEMAAQQQSSANKWVNAIGKMAGVGTGAFISGTAGLIYGMGKAAYDGKFSSLYNNEVTQSMDNMTKYLEDALPNYYTAKERDADWWSPDNLFTANFWADKVLKNLGYSAGALGGGVVWAQLLKGIGLTNKLVKAGRALELVEATEKAMTAVPRVQQFAALQNTLSSLGQKFLQGPAASILKSSDRIITSAMGTFGEASLEALQNMNEFRKNAIEEYKATYGVEPTGAALDEINDYSTNVGNFTWGFNTMLLTGTNYIQLPKLLGSSRKNDKLLLGDIERDLSKPVGSQWYTPRPGLISKTKGAANLFFAPSEAFEEGAQFAIQTGTDAYFNRAYENKEDVSSFFSNLAGAFSGTLNEGVEKTLSTKEGLESILIGGVSGGIQQARGTIREQGVFGTGGERGRNTELAVSALNKTNLNKVLQDQVNYTARAINSQRLRLEAIANNDVLSEKDFERDYALSYVMPRVKYGKVDSINEEVDYYLQQSTTTEGFDELKSEGIVNPNESREQFVDRINNIKALAQSVNGLYSQINDKYSAFVDKDGKRIFSDDVVDRMVYAASKVSDYTKRIPEVNNSLLSAGINTQPVLDGIIANNEPSVEATKEALEQINSLDILSEEKDNLKRDLQDVIELSLRRKMFIDDYDGIRKNPIAYQEVDKIIETEEPIVVKQAVVSEETKRKKTVEKELELGREYSLKQLARLEDGKLTVAPKLTVLSKTLGGEYEVRLPDGTETFLRPEEFRDYELTEQDISSEDIEKVIDDAIDTVLAKKKYKNIDKPTGNKVSYVNSLNNQALLNDIEKEIESKSKEFLQRVAKEEELAKQENISRELKETSDIGIQTSAPDAGNFEPDPKKTDQEVQDSTKPPVEGYSQKEPLAEHHIRANRFGANFYKFANRDNFRGVIVTQGNEKQVGVPGLMQWLKDKGKAGAPVDPSKTIALVVMGIDPITNERYFVGVDGERLKNPTLENTIYQTFPETLDWSGGGSMFRKTTPETVAKAIAEDYGKWRTNTLLNPTVDLYKIEASFGTPQYEGELGADGKFKFDNTARVSVEDSGLISETDLRTKLLIDVPTTDGAFVYGTSTFNNVKGAPLLRSGGGLVRLRNRNITKSEASLIYDAIAKLSNNLFKDGNLKSNESVMLYNWLKSVIYWGTPTDAQGNRKPAGFSSVFFDKMELIMGKEEKKFSLKPSDLAKNKAAIIDELQKMYNNVNSTLVTGGQKKDWNKEYTEITAITPEGIQTRKWKNYQSFLLSKKNPDGSARNSNTIPLTTRIRPLKNAEDTNRKGIYFTVIDKKGNTSQEATPTTPTKKIVTPATETEPKKEKPVQKFDLEGGENVLSTKIGDLNFKINKETFIESDGKKGILLPDAATDPVQSTLIESVILKLSSVPNSGITENTPFDDATAIAEGVIKNLIRAEVKKQLAPAPAPAPVAEAAPTAPVADKKADIERRRTLELSEALLQDDDKWSWKNRSISELKETLDKEAESFIFLEDENWIKINAKYDAELAALEEARPAAEISVSKNLQDKISERKKAGRTKRGSDYSLMIQANGKKFKPENWKKVEDFLKVAFPKIPVYRVKNFIQAINGRRAFGMFKDGAIYLSENAEVGTIYHEVFHPIWQSLTTPEERVNIGNEFRSRTGSFFDKASLKDIKYSEATDKQMEERLAEELRNYLQEGIVPVKPKQGKSWIANLFSDILEFFKTFFTGEQSKSNVQKLFDKIGSGYFAQYSDFDSSLSFAKKGFIDIEDAIGGELADYSLDVFTAEQVHDIMQHMTYITVRDLFEEKQGLFTIVSPGKKADVLKKLQDELGDLIADNIVEIEEDLAEGKIEESFANYSIDKNNILYENIINEWEGLTEKFEEYLKSYSIEFDENDELALSTDEKSKEDGFGDARKIDSMRKTNAAIKLLLASLPVVGKDGSEKLSSIGGYTLLPMSEMFMGTLNRTHNSRSITEMLGRIKNMADDDPKYKKLYNRLSRNKNIDELDDTESLQLLSALWRSFKKQNPTVKTVYILDNGDVQVGDANFTVAARQIENEFVNDIKKAITDGSKYFVKAENGKSYVGNEKAISEDVAKDDVDKQVAFLKELNIEFDADRLKRMPEVTDFSKAVNGIRASISNGRSIISVGGRTLDISGRLRELSEIKAKMDNPEFNSTYYNVNGELTQTFIGTNAASDLYDTLSQIKNLNELENTQYAYLLTDSFANNSVLLYKMFDRESGKRIEGTENLLQTAYIDGTVDQKKGRQKESSKLNYKERLVQQLNLNAAGFYLNLVPGDASIEWAQYMGNAITKSDILTDYGAIHTIFKGYLEDELALVKENRPVAKGKESKDLRFFKGILGPELTTKVLEFEGDIDKLYESLGSEINAAIDTFINRSRDRVKNSLVEYGALIESEGKFKTEGLSFGREEMSLEEINTELAVIQANFAINNIELHKLLYSDPYQYSDELKRVKSFNSPRQSIINSSPEMNAAYHKVWNRGFKEGDLGHTNFDVDFFRAATAEDVMATSDLKDYGVFEETDGGGIIALKALRNFKIRAGEWDNDQERQYKHDIAYEELVKSGASEEQIEKFEKKNPGVKRTYTPIKPIVSGNKANGRVYNDVMLDKFALYPLSFRIMHKLNPTANAIKLYDKMQAEDVDYVVFKSGRKVGAEKQFPLYKDGKFNEDPFVSEEEKQNPLGPQTVLNVPFAIIGIQSEVPSKDANDVTRGSQVTKLATLDFMEAGVPIDFMSDEEDFAKRYTAWNALDEDGKLGYNNGDNLYKEIKTNQDILETLVEEGINELTERFGLIKTEEGYEISSIDKVAEVLKEEITKRELNDNISAALKGYKNGDTFLEATPAYQQIRNILYSIADRNVFSPKVTGGMKVQIPSTLLESERVQAKNGAYTSDILKFYEDKDGKRYAEIMIGRWFKSDLTDDELLTYLNETPEGQKILEGIAFRIPTQKQNSIDIFRIKKFLPEEFGDSVVIPSALVKKVGSDFDIDKLSIYLKNVDVNKSTGEIREIPYQGTTEEVRSRFKNRRDFKKSLENGYVESLQKLVSHPLNFANLVKPNSADELKKLSREIVNKLGLGSFDSNNPANMLDIRFMSRYRQALVTGKYAIGIAAVNQTNHSLNQRSAIYIDVNRANLSRQDKKWLRDASIKFKEYNTIDVDGKQRPTVSMIKNKDGKYISDILSQLIDGYVDISKDTWVMEMGVTPSVASTWMFLIKVGVPVEDVAYFMNQPIIREYLRGLDKKGTTWLFNDRLVKNLERKYKGASIQIKEIPPRKELLETIGKTKLSQIEKAEQTFMLREFLKYAKMGEQMFVLTQGTNFDTSTFNDPFLLSKKLYMLDKARNTIFSSADKLLETSFLGKLKDGAIDVREAYAQILKMDQGNVREVLLDVLTPYMGMNDRDFIRTAQRAVTTLIDWAVQTEKGLNTKIESMLLSKESNVAKRVDTFIKSLGEDHPLKNNHVIKTLKPDYSDVLKNEPNNLTLTNKTNKIYDQNQIIYSFKEIKNYLKSVDNLELYNDIVTLSILQSGLTQSTVSFTSMLPYDDVREVYNDVIANLPSMSNLKTFKELNVFERTYWNYDDVVPHMEAEYKIDWMTGFTSYNENMMFRPDIYDAMKSKDLPILLKIPPTIKEANYDVIVYTYEKQIPAKEKREMRKRGDYSYVNKGLFKKVGLVDGGNGNDVFIYKAINAWGDGIYAKEFYNVPQKSKMDNGIFQSNEDISDDTILSYFGIVPRVYLEEEAPAAEQVVEEVIVQDFDAITDFTSERKQEILTNFANKHNLTKEKAKKYIDEALQKDAQTVINKLNECY